MPHIDYTLLLFYVQTKGKSLQSSLVLEPFENKPVIPESTWQS